MTGNGGGWEPSKTARSLESGSGKKERGWIKLEEMDGFGKKIDKMTKVILQDDMQKYGL